MVLQVSFVYKSNWSTVQQGMVGAWTHMGKSSFHQSSGFSPPWGFPDGLAKDVSPQTTCHSWTLWPTSSQAPVKLSWEGFKSDERREWVGRALAAFCFNEQKSLCTNTACETFCFRGQVYCPYIISIWQRKECALSSFRWMQPRSKITSEAVNNNFESISRIV